MEMLLRIAAAILVGPLVTTGALPAADTGKPVGATTMWTDLAPFPDYFNIGPVAMNERGDVIANTTGYPFRIVPVLWTGDGRGPIAVMGPDTGNPLVETMDINERGTILCGHASSSPTYYPGGEGYLWQDGAATVVRNDADGLSLYPIALNDADQVVAAHYVMELTETKTYLWDAGKTTALPFNWAVDINNRGEILGRQGGRPALWRDGMVTDLGSLGGSSTTAIALNDLGQVIGSSELDPANHGGEPPHPYLWRGGVMTDLLAGTGATTGAVNAINDAGQAVGQLDGRPVLWQDGQPRYLTAAGLTGDARRISRNGTVVGIISGDGLPPGKHLFTWHGGSLTVLAPPPNPAAEPALTPLGVDEQGRVVVQYLALGHSPFPNWAMKVLARSSAE